VSTALEGKSACLADHERSQLRTNAGQLRGARETLRSCSRPSCPEFVRADCVRWLEGIDNRLPSVVLVVRSPEGDAVDVRVSVDGELITGRLDGKPIEIDPGVHQFHFELPARAPVDQQLLVVEGEKNRRIEVVFPTERPTLPAQGRVAVVVLSSGAVLALGSFAYFGIAGIQQRRSLVSSCAPFCDQADVSAARTKLLVADISLGVALASASAALWALLSRDPPSVDHRPPAGGSPHVAMQVEASGGAAKLVVRGAF